jgi:hypothetical protein
VILGDVVVGAAEMDPRTKAPIKVYAADSAHAVTLPRPGARPRT